MIKEKAEKLSIEQYADNNLMLESYLELLRDNDIDPSTYIEMMYLMRNNIFMVKAILILGDYLSKRGLLEITDDSQIILKGEEIDQNEVFALTETFRLIGDITPYMAQVGEEELELLNILFENEILKQCGEIHTDSEEVQ